MDDLLLGALAVLIILSALSAIIAVIINRVAKPKYRSLNAVFNTAGNIVVFWTGDFTKITANAAAYSIFSSDGNVFDIEKFKSVFQIPPDTEPNKAIKRVLKFNNRKIAVTDNLGNSIYILWQTETAYKVGSKTYMVSIGTDITEKENLKMDLSNSNQLLSTTEDRYLSVLEGTEIGIFTVERMEPDPIIKFSRNAYAIFGMNRCDGIRRSEFEKLIHPGDYNGYLYERELVDTGECMSVCITVRLDVGSNVYHLVSIRLKGIKDYDGNVIKILGSITDVQTWSSQTAENAMSVFTDTLTGISNRLKVIREGGSFLNAIHKKNSKAAIVMLDVCSFDKINTLFGMEIADKVLKLIAKCLNEFETEELLVARAGSDVFTVLMSYKEKDDIIIFLTELQSIINDHIYLIGIKDEVVFNAGICEFDGIDDIVTLMNKANVALTSGKRSGTKYQFFDEEIERMIVERQLLEQEITEALIKEEFELYYQPKISLKSGKLEGVEALMRWNHPHKGMVSPGIFIPIAEEMGIITKLDEWGLMQACRQNKAWQAKGFPCIKVSVNMSQAQFYQTDVITSIRSALEVSGLDPKWLEVELTETMAMQDVDRTIKTIGQIKQLGVSISMDDFGSGYSSLSSLKQIPIDVLKIDRSLIIDVEKDNISKYITSAIVSLGRSMDLVVLAEGVETEEQCKFLGGIGCDLVQGFYYGRPQSAKEIERFFVNPIYA